MYIYIVSIKPKEILKFAISYPDFYLELPKPYNELKVWSDDLDSLDLQQFAINYFFYIHNDEVITARHITESGFHFEIPFNVGMPNQEILITFPHWSYFCQRRRHVMFSA